MSDQTDLHRRWEVRPTLRLPGVQISNPLDQTLLDRVAKGLQQHTNVEAAHVWFLGGQHSWALTATILFAQPLSLGAAVEEATNLLAQAGAAAGLVADVAVEVTAEPGGVDPRTLL